VGGKKAQVIDVIYSQKKDIQWIDCEAPVFLTALKIASYLTIVIPFTLLIAKAILRSSYTFTYQPENSLNSIPATLSPIDKIKQLSNTKLCLFVGRTKDEKLPEAQADETWISLDRSETIIGAFFSSKQMCDNSKDPERIHLVIDLNDADEMSKIHRLFDKVVLDKSVIKFINLNPWIVLQGLLKNGDESELISETDAAPIFINVDPSCMERVQNQFDQSESARIKNNLSKLFKHIRYFPSSAPYPYKVPDFSTGELLPKSGYIIARGVISESD
jgi:hypothetical protein